MMNFICMIKIFGFHIPITTGNMQITYPKPSFVIKLFTSLYFLLVEKVSDHFITQ